ncbi:MAG: ATP-binding cassette domain-containing protein [Puniceicoccales bacterium]|jgi:ATP-binding cassette subfamily F protein 3|nr:ATP-binding cassette domain-containing protein [Puniceicoccales bacterium]
MLQAESVTYQIGARVLFDDIFFSIPDGAKVGIVGPNGVGKTTLFRIILGEIAPDRGEISHPQGYRFVHVRQEMDDVQKTALDLVLDADWELIRLRALLDDGSNADENQLADLYDQFADIGGFDAEARAATILSGLGFSDVMMRKPLSEFSGGWRVRASLASTLFAPSDCLLLDEPTNHLDFETAIWLENHLKRAGKAMLIISHEKSFLNNVCDHILCLSDAKAQLFRGNYDIFRATFDSLRRAQLSEGAALARKREHLQSFVDRFRAKASKAKQAQSRMKMLEKMDNPPPPPAIYTATFQFQQPAPEIDRRFISAENIVLGYGEIPVLRGVNLQVNAGDRIALLGANGNGKSTLAKALAGRLAPIAGTLEYARSLKIAYFAQHQEEILELDKTPMEIFQVQKPGQTETQIRSQLARFGIIKERSQTRTERLSGGEKTRLLLAIATLDQPHLLILDEPTNHLDVEAREALTVAINNYAGAMLLVTHDFQTLRDTCRDFYIIDDGTCRKFNGALDEYARWLLERNADSGGKKNAKKPLPRAQKEVPSHAAQRMEEVNRQLEEGVAALGEAESALINEFNEETYQKFIRLQSEVQKLEALYMELMGAIESGGLKQPREK